MTIVEALKAFYKNSVEDKKKLNDANSVLEVLRTKYGDYKGSNVAEYVQELVENNISPGGGVTPTGTITITENGEGIDVSEYAYADVNVSGGGGDVVIFTYDDDWSCNMTYAEAKTYWTTYNLNTICPCQKVGISSSWVDMRFADDTMLPSLEAIFDFDDDVTEAIVVFSLEGQSTTFHVAYGNNGKLYKPNM